MGELSKPINVPPQKTSFFDIHARSVAEEMGVGNLFEGCICPERGLTPQVAEMLGADLYVKLNELIVNVEIFGVSADLILECVLLGVEVEKRLSNPDSIPKGVFPAETDPLLTETSSVDFGEVTEVSGNIFTQNSPLSNILSEANTVITDDQTQSSNNSGVIHWRKRNQNPKLKARRGLRRYTPESDANGNNSSGSLFPKVPSR